MFWSLLWSTWFQEGSIENFKHQSLQMAMQSPTHMKWFCAGSLSILAGNLQVFKYPNKRKNAWPSATDWNTIKQIIMKKWNTCLGNRTGKDTWHCLKYHWGIRELWELNHTMLACFLNVIGLPLLSFQLSHKVWLWVPWTDLKFKMIPAVSWRMLQGARMVMGRPVGRQFRCSDGTWQYYGLVEGSACGGKVSESRYILVME